MQALVTVIIPTKNGADTIERCLTGIANQTYKNIEVIVIDSGSTDNTIDIASNYAFVKIINILPSEFNHGTTRNFAVSKASGEFVVMTVQDAYPADEVWIEQMLIHFKDKEVVGVCGQQIVPHDADKNPHEWFRPFSKPVPRVVHFKNPLDIKQMTPNSLREACGWDNVNSMYRKSVFLTHPFPEVSFGEDLAWAKSVVLSGKKIIYDYKCRVHHYHHSTYDFTYKRTLTVYYHTYLLFGCLRRVEYTWKDYILIIYRNFKYRTSLKWIFFNWRIMKAKEKASEDLRIKLDEGLDSFKAFHDYVCKTPPQGKQNG